MEVSVNTSANSTNQTDFDHGKPPHVIFLETVLFIAAAAGIIGNVLIITVILKFQKTRVYYSVYLLSWCVSNSIFLFSTPLLSFLESHECYVIFNGALFFAVNLVFVAALSLDWFITTYYPTSCAPKCRALAKFINFVVWLLVLVFLLNIFVFCNNKIQMYITIVFVFFCILCGCFVGICTNILCLVKRKTSSVIVVKSYLVLILVSSFILGWVPTGFCFMTNIISGRIYESFLVFAFSIGQLNSLAMLFLLYRYDKHFKIGFRALSRCKEDHTKDVDLDKQDQYAPFAS